MSNGYGWPLFLYLTIPSMYPSCVWAGLTCSSIYFFSIWAGFTCPSMYSGYGLTGLDLFFYLLWFQSYLAMFFAPFFPVIFNDWLLTLFAFQPYPFPVMYQDSILSRYAVNLHPLQWCTRTFLHSPVFTSTEKGDQMAQKALYIKGLRTWYSKCSLRFNFSKHTAKSDFSQFLAYFGYFG